MNNLWSGIVTILVAIVGFAILATLVSKNANTSNVIKSAGSAFSSAIRAATGPVSGGFGGAGLDGGNFGF
jgi:hypothetical protein